MTDEKKLHKIEAIITKFGGEDGGHHKQWVLDQVIRIVKGDNYPDWCQAYRGQWIDDDEHTGWEYPDWDAGIAP